MISQTEIFLNWYEKEKKEKGLVDIKFFPGDVSKTTQEDFFREANLINQYHHEGISVKRDDIF